MDIYYMDIQELWNLFRTSLFSKHYLLLLPFLNKNSENLLT